ncbi:hypothetical protein DFH09DRAFT_1103477 [Mycena vulgaris]|nr:hypothetical protein DFH09DRAFT_1103477 [Mycena vulgaris]
MPAPDVLSAGAAALTHGTTSNPLQDFNAQFDQLRQRRGLIPVSELTQYLTEPPQPLRSTPILEGRPAGTAALFDAFASGDAPETITAAGDNLTVALNPLPALVLVNPPDDEDEEDQQTPDEDLFADSPTLTRLDPADVDLDMDDDWMLDPEPDSGSDYGSEDEANIQLTLPPDSLLVLESLVLGPELVARDVLHGDEVGEEEKKRAGRTNPTDWQLRIQNDTRRDQTMCRGSVTSKTALHKDVQAADGDRVVVVGGVGDTDVGEPRVKALGKIEPIVNRPRIKWDATEIGVVGENVELDADAFTEAAFNFNSIFAFYGREGVHALSVALRESSIQCYPRLWWFHGQRDDTNPRTPAT